MKTTKYILCAGILLASLLSKAQTISYNLIESDPDKYKRTALHLGLLNFDTYNGMSVGSIFKLETVIADRIMPWAEVRPSWLDDATHHVVSGYPTAVGGLKKQLVTDFGSAFFLVSKNKRKKVKVILSSSSSRSGRMTRTTTHYVMIPSEVKRMFGVRGGIYSNRRVLEMDESAHPFYHYKSLDGQTDVAINNVGQGGSAGPTGEYYKPLPMAHIMDFYGGLHYRKVTNTIIRTGGRQRCNTRVLDLFADVMTAPVVSISNVVDNSGQEWKIAPQSGAIKRIGWRAGFISHSSRGVGFEYSVDFGQKPGPVLGKTSLSNGTYLSVCMGMNIGSGKSFNVKHKKKKEAPKDN